MEIIDAQIHEPEPVRPWEFGEESQLALSVELAREAIDSVGVDVALINARQEFAEAAVARYPARFAAAGRSDYRAPDVAERIAAYRSRPGMLAMRTSIIDWAQVRLTDDFLAGKVEPVFAACERHEVPLFVFASGNSGALAAVARAHPDLQLIVDHTGIAQPPMVPDWEWRHLPTLVALAEHPNVAIKFSGGLTLSREPYPHRDVWPHLLQIVEAYGPDRLMWGSDFTRCRMTPGTLKRGPRADWSALYSDSVDHVRDTDQLSAGDKEKIFSGTIRRLLRWPKASRWRSKR
jgi:L-fuconolactonase